MRACARGDDLGIDLTPAEIVGTAMGFQPARLAEMYEGRAAVKGREARLQARRSEILNMWVAATMAGDREARAEAINAAQRFSRQNPAFALNAAAFQQAYRAKLRNAAQIRDGIFLSPRRDELREEGAFAKPSANVCSPVCERGRDHPGRTVMARTDCHPEAPGRRLRAPAIGPASALGRVLEGSRSPLHRGPGRRTVAGGVSNASLPGRAARPCLRRQNQGQPRALPTDEPVREWPLQVPRRPIHRADQRCRAPAVPREWQERRTPEKNPTP